jgi:hypothetical protein
MAKKSIQEEHEAGRGRNVAIVGAAMLAVALVGSIAWRRRRHRNDLP